MRFTLRPTKQTCIALGAVLGLGLLAGGGLYTWQAGRLARIETDVQAKEQQVASGEKVAKRLIATEAEFAGIQDKLRYLETSVAPSQYIPTLLRQMEALARSVNLQVGAVRPRMEQPKPVARGTDKAAGADGSKPERPQPYDKVNIDMELRGTYWNIARLLYRLTTFPKILSVTSADIRPIQGADKSAARAPELSASLQITGFIYKQEERSSAKGGAGSAPGQASVSRLAPPVFRKMDARANQALPADAGARRAAGAGTDR